MSRHSEPIRRGWFELLYRNENTPPVQALEDLGHHLYTMHGGQVSTEEFDTVFQVYEVFGEENPDWGFEEDLPRPLRHGDCLNLILKFPDHLRLTTLALLDKNILVKMQLRHNRRVEIDRNYNIALVPLKKAFKSVLI